MKHIQLSSFLKAICPLFILCSISLAQQSGEEPAPSQPLSGIDAASALVQRVTPEYGDKVSFTISKKVKKTTIAAKDSETIVISAPSVFECARGYGYYLRHVARVHLSWNGDNKSAARFIPLISRSTTALSATPEPIGAESNGSKKSIVSPSTAFNMSSSHRGWKKSGKAF